jgi:hypothetical protein
MNSLRNKATKLRRSGRSYRYISDHLGVAKSTLYYWFKGEDWSEKIKNKLSVSARLSARERMIGLVKKVHLERDKIYKQKRREADASFKKHSKEVLFNTGLVAYWGEGDNKLVNGKIRITNSNPLLLKLFHKFIKQYLPEISHQVKMYLVLYPDLDDVYCRNVWSKTVNIPLDKFFKSQYIIGRSANKKLALGVGTLIISSRAYKEVVLRWLELKQKEIKSTRV